MQGPQRERHAHANKTELKTTRNKTKSPKQNVNVQKDADAGEQRRWAPLEGVAKLIRKQTSLCKSKCKGSKHLFVISGGVVLFVCLFLFTKGVQTKAKFKTKPCKNKQTNEALRHKRGISRGNMSAAG